MNKAIAELNMLCATITGMSFGEMVKESFRISRLTDEEIEKELEELEPCQESNPKRIMLLQELMGRTEQEKKG